MQCENLVAAGGACQVIEARRSVVYLLERLPRAVAVEKAHVGDPDIVSRCRDGGEILIVVGRRELRGGRDTFHLDGTVEKRSPIAPKDVAEREAEIAAGRVDVPAGIRLRLGGDNYSVLENVVGLALCARGGFPRRRIIG